mmetsp:Transcript_3443/g.14182  ORF Transcript_3443/g.14182 Transcript_3443/m.14182 type:complete len:201 (+) Transcript_3443:379-981(+)
MWCRAGRPRPPAPAALRARRAPRTLPRSGARAPRPTPWPARARSGTGWTGPLTRTGALLPRWASTRPWGRRRPASRRPRRRSRPSARPLRPRGTRTAPLRRRCWRRSATRASGWLSRRAGWRCSGPTSATTRPPSRPTARRTTVSPRPWTTPRPPSSAQSRSRRRFACRPTRPTVARLRPLPPRPPGQRAAPSSRRMTGS